MGKVGHDRHSGEAYLSVRRVRLLVGVVALGFVLALVLGSAGLLGGGKALGSSTTITVIGGDVQVRHGATGQFVAAVDGEVLSPGDAIRTDTDSRAVLTFYEGSTVTIEPGTELAIDAAAPQGNNTIVQMTQSVGRTWHVVTKLVTGDSKYEVRTPASTASVRGTEFTVDTDGDTTTITTTGGTVLDRVPNPSNPGTTTDVAVTPGLQHSQTKNQPVVPAHDAPPPDRKVTVTLDDQNSLVIDTLGRANGIDKNGRTLLQTPGATLSKVDGHLVITLPNIPDGRLQALTRKTDGDVNVTTTTEDKGQGIQTAIAKISSHDNNGSANGLAGLAKAEVAIGNSGPGGGNGNSGGNNAGGNGNGSGQDNSGKSDATPTPTPTDSATPQPTQASGGGNGGGGAAGGAGGGTTSSGTTNAGGGSSGSGGTNAGNAGGNQGQGQGQGSSGQDQGQQKKDAPTPTNSFVPNTSVCLPTNPAACTPPPLSPGPGNSGQNTGNGQNTGGGQNTGNGQNTGGGQNTGNGHDAQPPADDNKPPKK